MKLKTREVAIFGMLGALMYASKVFMELLPNVHLLGVFTISFTLVYRKKALYPIYTYVLLNGLFAGFARTKSASPTRATSKCLVVVTM